MTFKHQLSLVFFLTVFGANAQTSTKYPNDLLKWQQWADKTIVLLISGMKQSVMTPLLLPLSQRKPLVKWLEESDAAILDYDKSPNLAHFDAPFSFMVENKTPIKQVQFLVGDKVVESFSAATPLHTRGFKVTQKPYQVNTILPRQDTTVTVTVAVVTEEGDTTIHSRQIALRGRNRAGRIALVIGNAHYKKLSDTLKNAVNDAVDMAIVLRELGFKVVEVLDEDKEFMEKSIDDFSDSLKNYETGLVYYAGHGVQHKGENYLIPIDCAFKEGNNVETTLKYGAIPFSYVMDKVEDAHAQTNIFIVDACRTSPIRHTTRGGSAGGLAASMRSFGGSIVAYSAGPNQIANDVNAHNDRNGLYTYTLLKFIKNCNLSVQDVFQAVRGDILSETKVNTQLPVETNMLTSYPCFCPK